MKQVYLLFWHYNTAGCVWEQANETMLKNIQLSAIMEINPTFCYLIEKIVRMLQLPIPVSKTRRRRI